MKLTLVQELKLLTKIFKHFGFTSSDAQKIADTLADADQRGIYSHGIQRLTMYQRKMDAGFIDSSAHCETLKTTPNCLVIDAHQSMGQLATIDTMQRLIGLAKETGIAFATIRNSNHFGAAGYYARMASQQNLIGLAATSTNPLLVPPNATKPFLGSNPLAFSVPTNEDAFTFDAATSTVSLGKVEVLLKLNQLINGHWAVDGDGKLAMDPQQVISRLLQVDRIGGILPIGGQNDLDGNYKGFAIALLIEIITSVFAEGSIAADLGSHGHDISHFLMVIDPNLFSSLTEFKSRMTNLLTRLKQVDPIDGQTITLPGDKQQKAIHKHQMAGIEIDDKTTAEIKSICKKLNIVF